MLLRLCVSCPLVTSGGSRCGGRRQWTRGGPQAAGDRRRTAALPRRRDAPQLLRSPGRPPGGRMASLKWPPGSPRWRRVPRALPRVLWSASGSCILQRQDRPSMSGMTGDARPPCMTVCATRNARGAVNAGGSKRGYWDGKAQQCRDRVDIRCWCQRGLSSMTNASCTHGPLLGVELPREQFGHAGTALRPHACACQNICAGLARAGIHRWEKLEDRVAIRPKANGMPCQRS